MEITKQSSGHRLDVIVKGRLDAYWSDHLIKTLDEMIREGAHHLALNLEGVVYLSSAGIRVLLQVHKQLKGLQGQLIVVNPSEPVKTVLGMAGLGGLFLSTESVNIDAPSPLTKTWRVEGGSATFDIFHRDPEATLTCQTIGNPGRLLGCRFREEDCQVMSCADSMFGLGLGAFGENFHDCSDRFGEFLAVAGAAAYLPTDGRNVPDFSVSAGTFVPHVHVLYGLACEGELAYLARFHSNKEGGVVALSDIVTIGLDIAETDVIGMVMIAESAGLLGATLKRSPTLQDSPSAPFQHPEIREWLSFTAERTHAEGVTLVVGIAACRDGEGLASFLRPLGSSSFPVGHFHAATFSYHPLKKGEIDLQTTVETFFEQETPRDILHLLNDHRDIVGAGESEFTRGACWFGPIHHVRSAQ